MLDILADIVAGWFGARLPWRCVMAMIVSFILLIVILLWITIR